MRLAFSPDRGCLVEEADPGWDNLFDAFWALVVASSGLVGMRAMVGKHGDEMSPHLVEMPRRDWTAEDLTSAHLVRQSVDYRMWRFMADYGLLLTPTLAVPPFPLNMQGSEIMDGKMVSTAAWPGFTFPIDLTGQPAATVPAGFTPDGLPVGLQVIGRHLADPDVRRASAAFEAAALWADH